MSEQGERMCVTVPSAGASSLTVPVAIAAATGGLARGDGAAVAGDPDMPDQQHPQHRQSPILTGHDGGAGHNDEVEARRVAASLELVEGYARALRTLHPSDADELAWYREGLRTARECAGLAPLQAVEAETSPQRAAG